MQRRMIHVEYLLNFGFSDRYMKQKILFIIVSVDNDILSTRT